VEVTSMAGSYAGRFDASCFDGRYITGDIDEGYLSALSARRNNAAKHTTPSSEVVDLHNGEA